jgi:hypothetical protein
VAMVSSGIPLPATSPLLNRVMIYPDRANSNQFTNSPVWVWEI